MDQEKRLSDFLIYRSKIGNGVTRPNIPFIIKELLDKDEKNSQLQEESKIKIFKDNLPDKSWVHRFISRHPNVLARTPDHNVHMKKQVTETLLIDWFQNLEDFLLEEHDLSAKDFLTKENSHRIFHLGETGFLLCGTNVLEVNTSKGPKNDSNIGAESQDQITVLGCVSGAGEFQKPFVMFPGISQMINFQNVNPEKYNVGNSLNGMISDDSFFTWFVDIFFQVIRNKVVFPIIVFMDGLSSRINMAFYEFFRKNNIILYCFPLHNSHSIQPLDICVYEPLKNHWKSQLTNYHGTSVNYINKDNFFTVFDEAWEAAKKMPDNVKSSFCNAGIIPFDANALDYSRLVDEKLPSEKVQTQQQQENVSIECKLGVTMALMAFERCLSAENLELFKKIIFWPSVFS